MRIVNRESVPESKLLRLAGSERPVEVEAVIDANGRVKVNRVIDVNGVYMPLAKPTGRFAIINDPKGNVSKALA